MPRWSAREAQTEPFAALVAVVVVALALALFAGVFEDSAPEAPDRETVQPIADDVERVLTTAGVAEPSRLQIGQAVPPAGYRTNVTLTAADRTWHAGPAAPETADAATRRVSVQLAPGNVRPGRLEVRAWR